ncbi:F0F1 ATP synthase subunit gamma [Oecophyllibacter saccharovorans]|uniref:ATP synthase gamma chain n=1 Tax=Oecophyllibacter saccharovorans TaxID=2558360 RepID=A0A506UL61_9PROT|nr:F0F1 ATP synthase subunit gamma [Oecophyllibacter saccharovorans]TPW34094.1 F0F1 ATP synthase subunit gamma [Oecophyllibacter saccharovorans]
MGSLKELRGRISGVKSTRKITNAMKMVAASKLRRAQTQALAARPYAETMRGMMTELAQAMQGDDTSSLPRLFGGTGKDDTHLLVIMTSDRGLVGGFNSNLLRLARARIKELQAQGKTVKILAVGRKGADFFAREMPDAVVDSFHSDGGKDGVSFDQARKIARRIIDMVEKGEVDNVSLFASRFINAMTQLPEEHGLVPLPRTAPGAGNDNEAQADGQAKAGKGDGARYVFEPDETELLTQLLPRNVEVQIYSALLESAAGEQGARMTAMDNSSRNASKFIDSLSLTYNRTRQANITRELIEIISGAEAV